MCISGTSSLWLSEPKYIKLRPTQRFRVIYKNIVENSVLQNWMSNTPVEEANIVIERDEGEMGRQTT